MALIKCPECTGKASDQAGSCPHCGYPVGKRDVREPNPDRRDSTISIGLVLSRLGAGLLILLGAGYIVGVVIMELEYNITASGEVDFARLFEAVLVDLWISAAWLLPIGMWWMWYTFHPLEKFSDEDIAAVELSPKYEEIIASLPADERDRARKTIQFQILDRNRS